MQQILFHLPFTAGWFPPDGIPLYGFGAMLFLCFVVTAMVWGPRRSERVGLPKERLQDMAILLFVAGIGGARVVYMVQYADQFKGKNLFVEFFKIWEGGIVFYGSVVGAVGCFLAFRHFVLRRLGVSTWKLGDAIAPLIAFGLAVGRIGCYLNGCCWGQVAVPEVQPVPLSAELGKFPVLASYGVREQVTTPADSTKQIPQVWGIQTLTGFTIDPFAPGMVEGVERGSEAAKVLKPGDQIKAVNGQAVAAGSDAFNPAAWPRGKKSLDLALDRNGTAVSVSYSPRTVAVFPTQLYEVVSMTLLMLFLLAYQPFRRHDGQLLVLLMLGYGVHRWLNEAIRIEPTYALGMTLSQWISVAIFTAGVVLEVGLRMTQPMLPKGPVPLGHGVPPLQAVA
ncbi:MAG: prolipoprotein diacylglyceryl transferase [Fimbriiglobus sp.]|jgi:prolipoprotein diacylglyceryltransferase|nr:prolipoprotein diacylglyceryl transferase [Fimbriiglobus sp.]